MSLIGSLEDLGLGDILQIISLSQKSGVLSIRGEEGEGQIVLKDGLVRGASLKGGPVDLREVLVGGRFVEAEAYDAACERARGDGVTIEEAIAAHTELGAERVETLRRECVEAAVMAMFAWRVGEFSFDVRSDVDPSELPLFLPTGINAQYLAMEGSRIEDESAHTRSEFQGAGDEGSDALPDDPPEMSAQEMFGVDPAEALAVGPGIGEAGTTGAEEHDPNEDTLHDLEGPVSDPTLALGLAVAERVDREPEPVSAVSTVELADDDEDDCDEGFAFAEPVAADAEATAASRLEAEPERFVEAPAAAAPPAATAPALPSAPLVVIDPDLVALEWIKHTLKDAFPRVHIFQKWDLGLGPIRQYLARATRPVVLLAPGAQGDPLSGIRNDQDFVSRLKSQQPRLPVLWLRQNEGPSLERVEPADGVLVRPSSLQLRSSRSAGQLQQLAADLREELAQVLGRSMEADAPPVRPASRNDPLLHLKEATAALAEASSRGEVLPLVIRFASELFERVAMFMVRGDAVVGMAQQGLTKGGGPPDESLRQVEISGRGSAWFRSVLETRRPVRSGPTDGGDYTLAALLGNSAAPEAYLAPIESGGEIVALLYADNLPSRRPLGDTETLEVVLQHAGLALERAVLERALAEAEQAPAD